TWAAATARRTSTPAGTSNRLATPSCARSSLVRTGAGASSIRWSWSHPVRHNEPTLDAPSASVLIGQHLRLRLSVRIEGRLVTLRPGCPLLRAADVPIGAAALQHR